MTKVERVKAVFRGETPDVTPAGFWFHYDGTWDAKKMAEAHLATYRETGMDIVKVMQDYVVQLDAPVQTPADWDKVKFPGTDSPVFKKLLDVLKRILDKVAGEAMVFQTMYGPLKNAVISYGDEQVMAHAKAAPDVLSRAVCGIAEALSDWAEAFVEAGASGLYYAAQFSEPGRFSRAEWEKLVKPADLAVLNAASAKGAQNILHICGEPDYAFKTNPEWFADYPAAIVNWSVKDTGLSLEAGRDLFGKPILGGMNNKGAILSGGKSEIESEARSVMKRFGRKGFMLGADCTIQGEGITHERLRAACDAAHG